MKRRNILQCAAFCVAVCILPSWSLSATTPSDKQPNIVFILADDLGYADLSCYGNKKIRTPNIDRLAANGVRFTDFYAMPVCTPARAALLTGCYPKRVGLHKGVLNNHSQTGLHPDEVTLAELLRGQGYVTACIGKWHLGETPETLPTNQGFDSYFGMAGPNHGASDLYRDTTVIETKGDIDLSRLTQRYTEAAVEFIQKSKDRKFFLYLPHSAVHIPLFAAQEFRGKSAAGLYGDMTEELDWSTGQVLKTLKDLGLEENTIVVFTSDNGPSGVAATPLHGGKGSTWEGGLRDPCIVRWPGHVPAGKTTHAMAVMFDWLPTLAAIAGAKLPADRKIDGCDIGDLITKPEEAKTPHDTFVYYGRDGRAAAIRMGKWKLHVLPPAEQWAGKLPPEALLDTKPDEPPPWLYDLEADIGETKNVAAQHADVVERLRKTLEDKDAELAREARPTFSAGKELSQPASAR